MIGRRPRWGDTSSFTYTDVGAAKACGPSHSPRSTNGCRRRGLRSMAGSRFRNWRKITPAARFKATPRCSRSIRCEGTPRALEGESFPRMAWRYHGGKTGLLFLSVVLPCHPWGSVFPTFSVAFPHPVAGAGAFPSDRRLLLLAVLSRAPAACRGSPFPAERHLRRHVVLSAPAPVGYA